MGLNNYNDDSSPMIEYEFRFIGEQTCEYERKNMYESEDLYSVPVELFNPVTKQVETRTITKWCSPVTHADVVEYIDNIISQEEYFENRNRKRRRKADLSEMFKKERSKMSYNELYELIELLQDIML